MKPPTRSPKPAAIPLCPYQQDWIADRSRFKLAVKARRIGFTFASTLEIALDLVSRRTRWLIISRTQDAARSSQATLDWQPSSSASSASSADSFGPLYLGADIGRKRDRTAIWIDERVADVAICRGIITLDRTPFEQQYKVFCDLLSAKSASSADFLIRRACIDQTGIGMALVERLQDTFGSRVEGVTFTNSLKEDLSLRVRRRMEERLDKIPQNASAIERDFAAVKREITASGNLRFDAERTDAGHADVYWAKALADYAADSGFPAACFGSELFEPRPEASGAFVQDPNPPRYSKTIFAPVSPGAAPLPDPDTARPSFWGSDRSPLTQDLFA
jgi:phage FluMu gp28-like protein